MNPENNSQGRKIHIPEVLPPQEKILDKRSQEALSRLKDLRLIIDDSEGKYGINSKSHNSLRTALLYVLTDTEDILSGEKGL